MGSGTSIKTQDAFGIIDSRPTAGNVATSIQEVCGDAFINKHERADE